ncbi:hypothetical protein JCM11641_006047 [Rhodosporidiobolus odoratus]
MEGEVNRLQGDQRVTNEVTASLVSLSLKVYLSLDNVKAAIQAHSADADSVEILTRQSPTKKRKRVARPRSFDPDTPLPVFRFVLSFSPPDPADDSSLATSLSSSSITSMTPLAPIYLSQSRSSTQTPHTLYIRHCSTDKALIEFDPLDPAAEEVTSTWTEWIAPPPVTQKGKQFKKKAASWAAKRAVRGEAKPVCPTGAGGLLDALTTLGNAKNEGVDLDLGLFSEPAEEDSEAVSGSVRFRLEVDVALTPSTFFNSAYSRSKRLLIDQLFPNTNPLSDSHVPLEAGIDYFYACLERAPRTVDGLPVPPQDSGYPSAGVSKQRAAARRLEQESDKDRAARLRREAKGKMRAVTPPLPDPKPSSPSQPSSSAYEGPQDTPLFPRGLTVELMPFQERSVRWMLGREGKWVVPSGASGEDEEMHDEDGEAEEGSSKPVKLKALSEQRRKEMKRGPLWEKVNLRALDDDGGDDGRLVELWLNRVSMQLSEVDPADVVGSVDAREGDGEKIVKGEEEVLVLGSPTPSTSSSSSFSPKIATAVSKRKTKANAKKKETGKAKQESEDEEMDDGDEHLEISLKRRTEEEGHGLLAEEVGLGKTVEVLSLILLHRDPTRRRLPVYFNPTTDSQVQPTGISLIIAPTSIVAQWMSEIERLTPGLKVLRYEGIKSLKPRETTAYIAKKFDVLLTTFDVLRKEIVFARKPAQRGLRNGRKISYKRSILVEIDFLRVILDEAQMVGDSLGPTSECASLISRRFSWAVTSTPLRDRIADLKPLLTFLRVEPIASGTTSVNRLLEEVGCFKRLWNEIGARTLKSQVTHELTLPKQVRVIVPVDLTAVEKFYYTQRSEEALYALGLSDDGTPRDTRVDRLTGKSLMWVPDKAEMNRWLTVLRQLAVHPQLGGANRQFGRVLRTVEEVYAAMREQAVSHIQSDQRALLHARVRRGQLVMWQKETGEGRFQTALEVFQGVGEEVGPVIDEITEEMHRVWKGTQEGKKKEREKNKKKARTSSEHASSDGEEGPENLARALELGYRSANIDDTGILSEKDRAVARMLGSLRNRLRDLLLVKHSALFFSGHANFNMKHVKEESEMYVEAEELRQTILQPYEDAVVRAQSTLQTQFDTRDENAELDISDFEITFNEQGSGLRAVEVFNEIEATSDVANGYAELIFHCRDMILEMVLTAVSIAGDNATGEEYEERAALQEKTEIYLEAYTVLINEWSHIVTGATSAHALQLKGEMFAALYSREVIPQGAPPEKGIEPDVPIEDAEEALKVGIAGPLGSGRNGAGADGEESDAEEEQAEEYEEAQGGKRKKAAAPKANAKEKAKKPKEKKQKTRFQQQRTANKKQNSVRDFIPPSLEFGNSPAEILRYELLVDMLEAKGEDREHYEPKPLRQLIKQLKDAAENAEEDEEAELAILGREGARLTKTVEPLEKVADRLRSELADLSKAFNTRLSYFAQLQTISDEVADPKDDVLDQLEAQIVALREDELELQAAIAGKQSRRRYLDNLNNPDDVEEEERVCPICQEFFDSGVLTNCAHLTCKSCFTRWHGHQRTCALCKANLPAGSYQNVKYRAKKAAPPADDDNNAEPQPGYIDSHGAAQAFDEVLPELSTIDEYELDRIREIETVAPLSSKSDLIVKALKHIRRREPEAKIVIFSAWQEALSLLMEAFTRNGVKYVRLEGATGKGKKEGVVKRFQEDPDIAAFFLHTRSQSAGLNLTAARYVFLVEPLLHPSLELQAVARVHRIGQRYQTVVHQFVVSETVDERVAELRARQGTSLFIADAQADMAKESLLGQTKDRASAEARKAAKTSDEAIDDEDDIARCLLSPEAFINLQRALLPFRLRENPGAASTSGAQQTQAVPPAPAHPRHAAIRPDRNGEEAAAMAGMAAAGRAAFAAEEDAVAGLFDV